jgi:hypothetical protein
MNLYDLNDKLLNVWVAKAEGHMIATHKNEVTGAVYGHQLYYYSGDTPPIPDYCNDPDLADPIIEKQAITTICMWGHFAHNDNHKWQASHPGLQGSRGGPTKLKAAMRAYVASKFGDNLPDEV